MKKFAILLAGALMISATQAPDSMDSYFYLFPEFKQGILTFKDGRQAKGVFNICALDNSVRYQENGNEMILSAPGDVAEVVIDGTSVVPIGGEFAKVTEDPSGVTYAVVQKLTILNDSHNAAYGGTSNTTAADTYSSYTHNGQIIKLADVEEAPYQVYYKYYVKNGEKFKATSKKKLDKMLQ